MSRWAFVMNADSDFTNLSFRKGSVEMFDDTAGTYFFSEAILQEPVGSISSDNRPVGLCPIPISPYKVEDGDKVEVTFGAVETSADPAAGVNLNSVYNPYAILYEYIVA